MTEEEKDRLRTAKEEVSEALARLPIADYNLDAVDTRLVEYTTNVAKHPDAHNLYEQLAARRFFMLVDKYGLNVTEIQKFITCYENLYFPGKTIATVAPGISEALIATAMGLFAAIPAVWAYNRYATKVERVSVKYDAFSEEFSSILQRQAQAD